MKIGLMAVLLTVVMFAVVGCSMGKKAAPAPVKTAPVPAKVDAPVKK